MKKVVITIALVLSLTVTMNAQERQAKNRENTEQLTPQQRNELHLKKMTLDLDLTPAQQKEIAPIISEQSSKREAKMTEMKANKEAKKQLTADEKFEMKNKMLDQQIEHKAKMKRILTKDQFEKWEANQGKRKMHMQKRRKEMKK